MSGFQENKQSTSAQNANQFTGIKQRRRIRKRKRCCRVSGCSRKDIHAFGYCHKHYQQISLYGKILERTINDLNELIDYEEYVGVCLYNIKHDKICETFIDKGDVGLIKKHKWHFSTDGYARTQIHYMGKKMTKRMHQILFPENKMTDHINRNKLDNRRCNLRKCTKSENIVNTDLRRNNTSGATGVFWYKKYSKWTAYVCINGKYKNIGYFSFFEEAVKARKREADKLYGKFVP